MRLSLLSAVAGLVALLGAAWYYAAHVRVASPPLIEAGLQEKVLTFQEANGRKLYEQYCLICHGATGEGDGFNAFNLSPRPRDFTEVNVKAPLSDRDLLDAIRRGGFARGKSSLMPGWGFTLSERQMRYLVAYLRTLKPT